MIKGIKDYAPQVWQNEKLELLGLKDEGLERALF